MGSGSCSSGSSDSGPDRGAGAGHDRPARRAIANRAGLRENTSRLARGSLRTITRALRAAVPNFAALALGEHRRGAHPGHLSGADAVARAQRVDQVGEVLAEMAIDRQLQVVRADRCGPAQQGVDALGEKPQRTGTAIGRANPVQHREQADEGIVSRRGEARPVADRRARRP